VLIIATGILGAQSVTPLMKAPKLNNYAAGCFAVGLTSRGCDTAKAFQVDQLVGAFVRLV